MRRISPLLLLVFGVVAVAACTRPATTSESEAEATNATLTGAPPITAAGQSISPSPALSPTTSPATSPESGSDLANVFPDFAGPHRLEATR